MIHICLVLFFLENCSSSKFIASYAKNSDGSSLIKRQKRKLTESYPYLRIGEEFGINSDNTSNMDSIVLQDVSDNIMLFYSGYRDNQYKIYAQVLDTNKNTIINEFELSSTSNDCVRPSAAILTDNKIVVVWYESFDIESIVTAIILNPDYSKFKGIFQVNDSVAGSNYRVRVVSLAGDRFVITWLKMPNDVSAYLVHFRIYDNNGDQITEDTLIDDENPDSDTRHGLAAMPGGEFISVWYSSFHDAIKGRVFNSDGETINHEFEISPSGYTVNPLHNVFSLDEQHFIVFWDMYEDYNKENYIYGQIFTLEGFEVGSYFRISETSTEWNARVIAAPLNDGGFVAVYALDDTVDTLLLRDIYARRFTKDWVPLEDERLVNYMEVNGNQNSFSVCQLSNGGYAVSWQLDQTDLSLSFVEPCVIENCLNCQNSIYTCNLCPDGYFEPNCEACSILCETCSSGSACETCLSPLIKDSGSCLCPDYRNPTSDGQCYCPESSFDTLENPVACQGCPLGCARCSSLTLCYECFRGFYLSEGECLSCQDTCADCVSFDECTECLESHELDDGGCNCPEYHIEENSVCVYRILTFTFNDTYYLEFSESLSKPLSLENISISVFKPNDQSFNFEVDFISLSLYRLKIDGDVPKDAENIQFKLYDVISESGSVIKVENSVVDQIIFIESSESLDEKIEEDLLPGDISIDSVSTLSVSLGIMSATGVSFLSMNPSALWSFINLASIIYFIPLQNIPIPAVIKNFTAEFASNFFNVIPNVGKLAGIREQESNNIPKDWKSYGIYQTDFLMNIGDILCVFFSGVACLLLLVAGYLISWKTTCKVFLLKRILLFKWRFFLRTWVQIYTDLMFYSLLVLFYDISLNFYSLLSGILLLIGILSSPLTIIYIRRAKNIENEKSFSTIFEEFRYEKGWVNILYYPLFFARRLIFCVSLFLLFNFPLAQVITNTTCSIVLVLYLAIFRAYKDFSVWILQLFSETVLVSIFVLSGFYLLDLSDESILRITQCIIFLMVSIPFFMLLIFLIEIYIKLRSCCRKRKTRKYVAPTAKDRTIHEIETHPHERLFYFTHREYNNRNRGLRHQNSYQPDNKS